ncbi:MAG: carboxypeptidase regulatory-like domain-containing protein [Cyanobacteria bacterium P01_F01_bin.116]
MVALIRESSVGLRYLKAQNYFGILLNSLGLLLLCSQPGWSHGAIATVTRTFAVEASYASGEPMAQAQVVIYSPENPDQPWTTGKTNQEGVFEFSPDIDGNWDVVIRQAGHGTTVSVPVETEQIPVAQIEESKTTVQPPTTALVSSSEPLTNPLQRWASAGAALWGMVGTVLFFSRGK